jgi:RNA polymerase sigma-70 factor (ECF subfamily)
MGAKKREALVLFELEGLSGQEIALALGVPLKTVWTRLHHARRELEEKLGDRP